MKALVRRGINLDTTDHPLAPTKELSLLTKAFSTRHELHAAAVSRLAQINAIKARLLAQTGPISAVAERLEGSNSHREDAAALRNAAAGMRTLISVLDED